MVCDGGPIDALKVGWDVMARYFWPFLGYSLVVGFIRIPADNLDNIANAAGEETTAGLWLFSQGYEIFVATPLSMGLVWVFLKAVRHEHFELGDIFGAFSRNYVQAVIAGVVQTILVGVGLLLLIVPGFYLMVKFAFVEYLVVDRKMGAIEAMKESWRMTDGREWNVVGLMVLSILIFIGGLIACIVGVIPAVIWLSASFAVLYHTYCVVDQPEVPEPRSDSDNPFGM